MPDDRIMALEAQVMELTQSVSNLTAALVSLRAHCLEEIAPYLGISYSNRLVPRMPDNTGNFRSLTFDTFRGWFPPAAPVPLIVSTPEPPLQRVRPLVGEGSVWDRLVASELNRP